MDKNQEQLDIEKFDTALSNTPEEVRSFIWSDAYKKLILAIQKNFDLSDDQKNIVEEIIFSSLTKTENNEAIEKKVGSLNLEEKKRDELLFYIFNYFIEPSINKVEETFELEKKEYTENVEQKEVSPAQALANIQERLSQSKIITPSKRDYSVEKINTLQQETPKATSVDPYRELPEK